MTSYTRSTNLNCRPPPRHTYLTIGQDLFSIQQYLDEQYNASLHRNLTIPRHDFSPAATMLYTDIYSLGGLDKPVDYGSGVEYANGLLDSVFAQQEVGLQVGLWLNGSEGCRDIVEGRLNAQVHALFEYLRDCKAPQVFLRVGYEFDNPSFGYLEDPLVYRHAFRFLYEQCLYQTTWDCPAKLQFVWHSWGASSTKQDLQSFYPGNDVVDWIGVSIFQQFENSTSLEYVDTVLEFAFKHNKPIMIAESTPFGGISDTSWNDWFEPLLEMINRYDISMWCYINCDWNSQKMWHDVGFGDTRLSTSYEIMEQWHDQVLQNPRFLFAGSLGKYCAKPTPSVERLSPGRKSRRHAKPHASSFRRAMIPRKRELLVASFCLFWIVLAMWVWQRQSRRRRRRRAPHDGFRRYNDYYGAVETTS